MKPRRDVARRGAAGRETGREAALRPARPAPRHDRDGGDPRPAARKAPTREENIASLLERSEEIRAKSATIVERTHAIERSRGPFEESTRLGSRIVRVHDRAALARSEKLRAMAEHARGRAELTNRQERRRRTSAESRADEAQAARRQAEADAERLGFLVEADRRLSTLDASAVLARVARLAVPSLADRCSVLLLESRVVRTAHAVPAPKGPPPPRPLDDRARDGPDRAMRVQEPDLATRRGDGEEPLSVLSVPLIVRGDVLGAMVFERAGKASFRETDIVRANDLVARAGAALERARTFERAKLAVRTRDQFLGMVSHDVKGLLGSIKLNADLLGRRDDENVQRMARSISRTVDRMARLMNDLLDVASIEAGKLRIVAKRRRAADLIREVAETFAPLAREKSLHLRTHAPADLVLPCDRERVGQALSNLVANAIKFTPAGGRVSVRAARKGPSAVFSVADTGPGIPAALRKDLFRRFSQGDGLDLRGVGLGLYIARAIVRQHGGEIGVDSRPGKGSRFHFALPLDDGRRRDGRRREGRRRDGRR